MPFGIQNAVPWGRSLEEYRKMFNLTDEDLKKQILGCSDGPTSFNFEMKLLGNPSTSIDPLYRFSAEEIQEKVENTYSKMLPELKKQSKLFIWNYYKTPEGLVEKRISSMNLFLDDFALGVEEKRYIFGSLPHLPFEEKQFDLVLCSHFLFLFSTHFQSSFHLESILELCRVAKEVRIFPLYDFTGQRSEHLDYTLEKLDELQCEAYLEKVEYEFQEGANEMLVVRK
ncbi:MAG: hypothetical protein ACI86H_001500 [bacterium]|jgi:hypothetical protein